MTPGRHVVLETASKRIVRWYRCDYLQLVAIYFHLITTDNRRAINRWKRERVPAAEIIGQQVRKEKMVVISDSIESFLRREIMRSGQGSMTVQILAKGTTNYLRI